MKYMKIGIISFFYDNINYGGALQTYALTRRLNSVSDVDAHQICYRTTDNAFIGKTPLKRKLSKALNPIKVLHYVKAKLTAKSFAKHVRFVVGYVNRKRPAFASFAGKHVPHTEKVYDRTNLNENDCDIFITGSDQVWNFAFCDDGHWLIPIPDDKYKMSYAPGMLNAPLTEEQKTKCKAALSSFDAISVREESSVDLLKPLTDKPIEWVVDPTLLLDQEEWDDACAGPQIKERYVFCYFLGELSIKNKDIMEFARRKGLKVVTMPYLCGSAMKDGDFGDHRIYDAGPSEFLSYIKHADYVFTDSFHASVFSLIYHRDFFVFNRKGEKGMSNRIESLTYLFDVKDRYCDSKQKSTLKYVESLPSIDYGRSFPRYQAMKQKSIYFLRSSLAEAEKKLKAKEATKDQGSSLIQ